MPGFAVKLHIYDLSRGLARQMSPILLGKQIDGIWHTGVVVYEKEFYYGSGGIEYCPPCGTILGSPDEVKDLGQTEIPEEIFNNYLIALNQEQFRSEKYNLFEHNCNTFSNEASQFLTGQSIPRKIQDLPQEILRTPFGAMIKPMIDSMTIRPNAENSTPIAQATEDLESVFEPRPDDKVEAAIMDGPKIQLKQSKNVPVIYNDYKVAKLVACLNNAINNDEVRSEDVCQVKEIEQALECGNENIVTESHLRVLESLLEKYEVSAEESIVINIIQTLSLLVLKDDIIPLVCQYPVSKPVFNLAREFSHLKSHEVQSSVVELFTNICSTDVGRSMFVAEGGEVVEEPRSRNSSLTDQCGGDCSDGSEVTPVKSRSGSVVEQQQAIVEHRDVIQVAVKAILDDVLSIKASALVYNISMATVSEESALECASAILERLKNVGAHEPSVYQYLFALWNLMKISPEIANLTNVIGVDLSKFMKMSERMEQIANELQQYLIV